MTGESLDCEKGNHTAHCRFIRFGGFISVILLLGVCLSSCMMTGFGGMTWNETSKETLGNAIAINPVNPVLSDMEGNVFLYLIEGEAESISDRGLRYNVNIEVVRMHFPDDTGWWLMPYITGGVGSYDHDTTLNAGFGIIKQLYELSLLFFVRLDYRHFFHDEHDGNRIYLGLGFGLPAIPDPG